jgi:catechol 2,3-dioxygenase-like lactoylglutathione lyase family enzyme
MTATSSKNLCCVEGHVSTHVGTKERALKRIAQALIVLVILLTTIQSSATGEPNRSKVFKIAYVRILSSDSNAAEKFYTKLGAIISTPARNADNSETCVWCEIEHDQLFSHIGDQVVLIKDDSPSPQNRINEIVFEVSDAAKMERYMASKGVPIRSSTPRLQYFDVLDPEGHRIGFVQRSGNPQHKKKNSSLWPLVHAGFVVHDRAAMDHFYRDILGFRPYWHGGMKDDQTDWVSLQVPDGTDWVEFMVNVSLDADKRLLGIMNHIALGVPDIHAVAKQLLTNGVKLTEDPKIGRDGKWQLNLYDPDQTRVELMEFTPVEKPCCSDYTSPHPKP